MPRLKHLLPPLFLTAVLLACPVYSQEKELTINGQNVNYDKEKGIVEAQGSVEVKYKGITLDGNRIVYDVKHDQVTAEAGFILSYSNISIEGDKLSYSFNNASGCAQVVKIDYEGIELTGKDIAFGSEEFELKEATFSTCKLAVPHYKVTAKEIQLYPKYGWLVAYWGFFWLGTVPVVPVPTYIYDLQAGEKEQKNLPPFPEIGSNNDDGFYINERLAWHVKRELSGTYSLDYATKKGLGGGAEADYILKDNQRGSVRFYGNQGDGLWGGVTHHIFFGSEIEEINPPVKWFSFFRHRQFELETLLSSRERINYQRVSYYPQLTLRAKGVTLGKTNVRCDATTSAGLVKEEGNTNLAEGYGGGSLYLDSWKVSDVSLIPALAADANFYSDGGNWLKLLGKFTASRNFTENLSLSLGYSHYFLVNGLSPFKFEMYRFNPVDRLLSDLFFMYGETGIDLSASYFLNNWTPDDIDYSLFFKLHCYNLMVKYRSMRQEFSLGFSLAGK